jgi:hypothetical protein
VSPLIVKPEAGEGVAVRTNCSPSFELGTVEVKA